MTSHLAITLTMSCATQSYEKQEHNPNLFYVLINRLTIVTYTCMATKYVTLINVH